MRTHIRRCFALPVCVRSCACVCACVRACVRVCVCVCVRACRWLNSYWKNQYFSPVTKYMVYYSLYRFPVYLERDQQPEPRSLFSGRGAHARNKGNEKKNPPCSVVCRVLHCAMGLPAIASSKTTWQCFYKGSHA